MEKSQLTLQTHTQLHKEQVIEVRYKNQLIATVYGADGPGIRVITKHPYDIVRGGAGEITNMVEVRIKPS